MKLIILCTILVGGVLGIPTGRSAPTCVSISYAKFEGPACGVIIFRGMSDKTVTVSTLGNGICNLDATSGSFPYHIHMSQIPSNGDCSAAGDHFDPYNVGDVVCDPNAPGSCQVGDCSGKHGKFEAPTGMCSYGDQYMSLDSGEKGYIGGRSVVIHKSDDTAFACANIIDVSSEEEIPAPDCSNVVPPTSATCDSTSPATDIESPPPETSTSCDTSPKQPVSTPVSSSSSCDAIPPPPPPPQTTDCYTFTFPPDQNNDLTAPSQTSDSTPCDRPTSTTSPPCDEPTTPPEEVNHATPPPTYSEFYSTDCDAPPAATPPPGQFNPFPPLTVTTSESSSPSNIPPPLQTDEGGQNHDFAPPYPTSSSTTSPTDDHDSKPSSQPISVPRQGEADAQTPTVTSTGQYVPGSTLMPTGVVTLRTSSIGGVTQAGTNAPLFTGGAGRDGVTTWTLLVIVGVSFLVII